MNTMIRVPATAIRRSAMLAFIYRTVVMKGAPRRDKAFLWLGRA
jgi:hypothetical protein